ncbi:guanylate kinase [uncultured Jannaschia sp.]|uniref:guanylate kinase n=1 Tax=uncultured Jannaschia sp. TaxID=293347 RepID=UPI0026203246|nr:guanylate kinase [uncultured Jannaschia sp.]
MTTVSDPTADPIAKAAEATPEPQRRGLAIILSSPSGAGKSTMARRLMAWDPTLSFSVSATTREPRPGEVDGREYHFINRITFGQWVLDGEMLEHAEVFDHHYGSPRAPVEAALASGRDVIFDIDWQGGQQVRNSAIGKDVISIFILPPSIAELERRLRERGQDAPETIARRMAKSEAEISHWAEYDYVLVNDDAEACEARLRTILTAERLRRDRQPWLSAFARGLNDEFRARERT